MLKKLVSEVNSQPDTYLSEVKTNLLTGFDLVTENVQDLQGLYASDPAAYESSALDLIKLQEKLAKLKKEFERTTDLASLQTIRNNLTSIQSTIFNIRIKLSAEIDENYNYQKKQLESNQSLFPLINSEMDKIYLEAGTMTSPGSKTEVFEKAARKILERVKSNKIPDPDGEHQRQLEAFIRTANFKNQSEKRIAALRKNRDSKGEVAERIQKIESRARLDQLPPKIRSQVDALAIPAYMENQFNVLHAVLSALAARQNHPVTKSNIILLQQQLNEITYHIRGVLEKLMAKPPQPAKINQTLIANKLQKVKNSFPEIFKQGDLSEDVKEHVEKVVELLAIQDQFAKPGIAASFKRTFRSDQLMLINSEMNARLEALAAPLPSTPEIKHEVKSSSSTSSVATKLTIETKSTISPSTSVPEPKPISPGGFEPSSPKPTPPIESPTGKAIMGLRETKVPLSSTHQVLFHFDSKATHIRFAKVADSLQRLDPQGRSSDPVQVIRDLKNDKEFIQLIRDRDSNPALREKAANLCARIDFYINLFANANNIDLEKLSSSSPKAGRGF